MYTNGSVRTKITGFIIGYGRSSGVPVGRHRIVLGYWSISHKNHVKFQSMPFFMNTVKTVNNFTLWDHAKMMSHMFSATNIIIILVQYFETFKNEYCLLKLHIFEFQKMLKIYSVSYVQYLKDCSRFSLFGVGGYLDVM